MPGPANRLAFDRSAYSLTHCEAVNNGHWGPRGARSMRGAYMILGRRRYRRIGDQADEDDSCVPRIAVEHIAPIFEGSSRSRPPPPGCCRSAI
jgi:hypothetical protein